MLLTQGFIIEYLLFGALKKKQQKALVKFIISHVRCEKYTGTHLDLWNLSAQQTLN